MKADSSNSSKALPGSVVPEYLGCMCFSVEGKASLGHSIKGNGGAMGGAAALHQRQQEQVDLGWVC